MGDPYRTADRPPVEPTPKKPWRWRWLMWAHVTGAVCFAASVGTCASCQGHVAGDPRPITPLTWALSLLTLAALTYTFALVIIQTEEK